MQKLFGDTGTQIIGTRHGEKLYETLMTVRSACAARTWVTISALQQITATLNYDKFVVKGEVHTMADEAYTSHNTNRLDVDGTVKKILTTDYVQEALKKLGGEARMNILITGAKGFVGKNLSAICATSRKVKTGHAQVCPIGEVYEYDLDTDPRLLDTYCAKADFVFNLAGVNRPKEQSEFMQGNFGFASTLLDTLKKHGNACPVMLSSSIQATLIAAMGKVIMVKASWPGKNCFSAMEKRLAQGAGIPFPEPVRQVVRPNYNSVVATFCNNIANDLPIQVNDPATELELVYIDNLVEEMLDAPGRERAPLYVLRAGYGGPDRWALLLRPHLA